jgi:hypothetical protein
MVRARPTRRHGAWTCHDGWARSRESALSGRPYTTPRRMPIRSPNVSYQTVISWWLGLVGARGVPQHLAARRYPYADVAPDRYDRAFLPPSRRRGIDGRRGARTRSSLASSWAPHPLISAGWLPRAPGRAATEVGALGMKGNLPLGQRMTSLGDPAGGRSVSAPRIRSGARLACTAVPSPPDRVDSRARLPTGTAHRSNEEAS